MNSVVIMIFFIEGLIFVNEDIFVESAIISLFPSYELECQYFVSLSSDY